MTNRYKGEVEIEALGQKWTMRLGMNETIELQDAFGLEEDAGPEDLMEALQKIKTLKKLRSFFHVVLRFAHPEIDEKTAGQVVTELGLEAGVKHVLECLRWAMPDREPAPAGGGKRGKGEAPGATS